MPTSQCELGVCFFQLGDSDRAMRCYERALLIDPGHAAAHFNRGLTWLKQGRFRDGWVEYEWRFAAGEVSRPEIAVPRWDGSPLNGRSILIHTEQGMGDVFQFCRFLPLLKKQGARVMTLAEVLELHKDGEDISLPGVPTNTETSVLRDAKAQLRSVRTDVWKVSDICKKTKKLLNEMAEHHEDQARVNRVIKDVYKLPNALLLALDIEQLVAVNDHAMAS